MSPTALDDRRLGTKSTKPLVVWVGALVIFLLLVALVRYDSARLDTLDTAIHHWVVGHRSTSSVNVAAFVTRFGASVAVVPLVFVGAVFAAPGVLTKRLQLAGLSSALLASGLIVRLVVAQLVARPRPPVADWAAAASGYAFPSGHTTGAAIAAGLLAWLTLQRGTLSHRTRLLVWSIAGAFAGGVGITRAWLGVHWPSDVLGGWAFALTWTTMSILFVSHAGLVGDGRVHPKRE
ncbi:MAG: phosphatase PAP2 family protein [Propionibacteriales bacterium]|nr:phosphatase PAP2 family protein [Propionibacteriales bacterium]